MILFILIIIKILFKTHHLQLHLFAFCFDFFLFHFTIFFRSNVIIRFCFFFFVHFISRLHLNSNSSVGLRLLLQLRFAYRLVFDFFFICCTLFRRKLRLQSGWNTIGNCVKRDTCSIDVTMQNGNRQIDKWFSSYRMMLLFSC